MKESSRKYKVVNAFLKNILGVDSAQAKKEARLMMNILSAETLSNLETSIQDSDSRRCNGCVSCDRCSFCERASEISKSSSDQSVCEFIHPACASWH